MDKLDHDATARQKVAYALLALVTMGWMAGLAIGIAAATDSGGSLTRTAPHWLIPALQGVIAVAIVSVAAVLTAVARSIRVRAHVLGTALPQLLAN